MRKQYLLVTFLKSDFMKRAKRQVVLMVLDGWGHREEKEHNAIAQANTPFFDHLWETYPHALIKTSGEAVGLPEGQMGSSEIGHMTIGAGKVIDTDLVRINKAIKEKTFGPNKNLQKVFVHAKKHESTLHLVGLIGPGGVHAHEAHLFALLDEAKKAGVKQTVIHAFTDGRDTSPTEGVEHLEKLESHLKDLQYGCIASVSGRYYGMDRDSNWERTKKAEQLIFACEGDSCESIVPSEYVRVLYKDGNTTDEFHKPFVCLDNQGRTYRVEDNDAVLFFNFRADRMRQVTERAIERTKEKNIHVATLTTYKPEFDCTVIFPDIHISDTLGHMLSEKGITQTQIAETEKFAHATYFLDGGREEPYPDMERILVESRKDIATHDEAPEMKAVEIADAVIEEIERGRDFIFVNFANADMVGHTGNWEAIIAAVELIDLQVKRIVEKLNEVGGVAFITADHGNAEQTVYDDGSPHTAHTTNPVPAIVTDMNVSLRGVKTLADIKKVIVKLLGI